MSGASNIFGTSAVSAGSRFSSPAVKIGVATVIVGGVFGAYMLLSGQAHDLFHAKSGPPEQPSPQTSPISVPFRPMPPPEPVAQSARPKAAGPASMPNTTGRIGTDDQTLGVISKIDLYSARSSTAPSGTSAGGGRQPGRADDEAARLRDKAGGDDALSASVTPTKFAASGVTELPHPDYLIEQGRHLPCTQMSMINSTYAGAVSAIIPTAIRGETGDFELIGPGAKVFGTIQHGMANGADRVFVLWQQITTPIVRDRYGIPHQFRVEIDSPASDQLGQTGLDGELNRHLPSKFAAVIGLSAIQGATQGLGNLFQRGGNNNNNFSMSFNQMSNGMDSGANLLMQQFLNVPDVLTRLQGKACEIELVRDLDMSAAYPKLRSLLEMGNR